MKMQNDSAKVNLVDSWKVLLKQHPVSGQYYAAGFKLVR